MNAGRGIAVYTALLDKDAHVVGTASICGPSRKVPENESCASASGRTSWTRRTSAMWRRPCRGVRTRA